MWLIAWQTALLAIIFSFVSFPFRKNGAISGPVAPINTVVNPLITPTPKKLGCSSLTSGRRPNKNQIINILDRVSPYDFKIH